MNNKNKEIEELKNDIEKIKKIENLGKKLISEHEAPVDKLLKEIQ